MRTIQKSVFISLILGAVAFAQAAQAQDWMKKLQGTVDSITKGTTRAGTGASLQGLSSTDIVAGLKEALRVGTQTVAGQLGQANGFNGDPQVGTRINPGDCG